MKNQEFNYHSYYLVQFYLSLTLSILYTMPKVLLFFLLFFSFGCIQAQDTTQVTAPKIISKLKLGSSIEFDSKSIKFVKVIEDSRCPTGVSCMWEGQAKVLIELYENGKLLETKELIFGKTNINPKKQKVVLAQVDKKIYAYTISPYPTNQQPILKEDYYLELIIK